MSIAALQELTLVGDIDRKAEIMDALQHLGAIHLVPLVKAPMEIGPDAADDFREALLYLLNAPSKRRLQKPAQARPLEEVVRDILVNKYARADVIDKIELIRQKQRSLAPWGDFELPPLDESDGYRFWFYLLPLRERDQLAAVESPWKIVHSDHRFQYLVVLSRQEPDIPFKRTHTGAVSLSRLALQKEEALVQLEDLEAERESLTRWILPLTEARDQSLDTRDLHQAQRHLLDAKGCFVLRGWMPESAQEKLETMGDELGVAWQLRRPTAEDSPPTLLQNHDGIGGGEEAVSFFQLPGYHAWDPSGLIFFSFALFFAMILADAGYALVLGAVLLLRWRRMSEPGSTALRIRNLWAALVGSSLVYGALVGSWFGITPGTDSWLSHLHLIDMNNFSAMMKLSLGAGVVHLMLANTMVAWTRRGSRTALASVGWITGLGSAFMLWLDYMADIEAAASPWRWGLVVAVLLILLFSGERRVNSASGGALQLFDGVKALYGLSRAFGDVLSYMRLFALGLSSASLAVTFNSLAVSARDGMDVGGGVVFVVILLLGHTMNFALALMSGVIHGLRLNLLEFYNWGIHGEGYPFKAFAKRGGSQWNSS